MSPSEMRFHVGQTLHAYTAGHTLQASAGHIERRWEWMLTGLSDLSGYLPYRLKFDHYYTGFPVGHYYAFAKTWYDADCERSGCVITHTLLVVDSVMRHLSDPWDVTHLHRRWNRTTSDLAPYRALPEATPQPLPDPAPRPAVMEPLREQFAKPDRPLAVIGAGQCIDEVRQLWREMEPAARTRFSFCTFSLGPREHSRSFDLLVAPKEAQGSLLKLRDSMLLFDEHRHSPARP